MIEVFAGPGYVLAVHPPGSDAPMKPRILLTTTSFQDTPGPHHDALAATGWEIVQARGPLNEADTLAAVGAVDGYICGRCWRRPGRGSRCSRSTASASTRST
jgi:hypothetical protein